MIHILLPLRTKRSPFFSARVVIDDDVGAGAGLAHGERADMAAVDELRQVFALLRLAAVAADLIDAEIAMRAVGEADRGRGAADLLHRDDMREIAHAGAAEFLFDGDAEQAERAHFRPEIAREFVLVVDLGGARRDLALGEAAHRVAQHVDLVAEIEIETGNGAHSAASAGCISGAGLSSCGCSFCHSRSKRSIACIFTGP